MEAIVVLVVLAALLLANVWATRVVLRGPYSERRQKVVQCSAVWLLPVFGAILIFALHREPEKPAGRYRDYENRPDDLPSGGGVSHTGNTHADDTP